MRWSRKRQGRNPNCYTFDGDGARRKETSKGKATQAETDTNKNLEAERKSERGCRVRNNQTLVVV